MPTLFLLEKFSKLLCSVLKSRKTATFSLLDINVSANVVHCLWTELKLQVQCHFLLNSNIGHLQWWKAISPLQVNSHCENCVLNNDWNNSHLTVYWPCFFSPRVSYSCSKFNLVFFCSPLTLLQGVTCDVVLPNKTRSKPSTSWTVYGQCAVFWPNCYTHSQWQCR